MKKLLALSLAMLFIGVGIASATDIQVKGSYYVRGSYFDNVQDTPTATAESFGNYDHELSVDVTFKIDDTSYVFTRIEARDETWTGDSNPATVDEALSATTNNLDDNVIIEQVFGSHTFGNGGTLQAGIMTGGVWATSFGNASGDKYRLKYSQPSSFGTWLFIIEKDFERSSVSTGNDEDDDTYNIGLVTKIGDINVKPLIGFTDAQSDTPASDLDVLSATLAIDGAMGNLGFEAEAAYLDYDYDSGSMDASVYGLYGNIWLTANALKVGVLAAYGSYDDDGSTAYNMGNSFEAGGALIMGDDITFGTAGSSTDLEGAMLIALYADYKVNDKLSVGGYLGYAESHQETNDQWDGADMYEISGDITYAITPNVTYKVAAGIADLSYGDSTAEPDSSVEIHHKLSFSF